MPERLKRLKRLRAAWAQRRKSTECRIASVANRISSLNAEEQHLIECRDGEMGLFGLFADVSTRRLLLLRNQNVDVAKKMDALRATHLDHSLNLRRCETFEERQALELRRKDEAASLEAAIEVFLQGKA
jgi:hypothetical protein